MKKYIFLFLLFGVFSLMNAQRKTPEQERLERKRLDSLCRKNPSICAAYSMLVGPHSVFQQLNEQKLKPKERHCYDKKINYRGLVNNRPVKGCYYVNTHDGLIAKRDDNFNSCRSLNDFQPGYVMSQFSMLGDGFVYEIDRRGNKKFRVVPVMEDWEEARNTTFEISDYTAYNNSEEEKLTDQNLPTNVYKILESSEGSQNYLFTPYRAEKIPVYDYLGMFGTGYYKDFAGNTIICLLKHTNPQNYIRIEKITEVNECFDGSEFTDQVEEAVNTEREISNRNRENLDNRARNVGSNCPARSQLIALERKMQDQSDRAVSIATSGAKITQADILALSQGASVVDEVDKNILTLKVKICDLTESLSSPSVSAEAKAKYSAEIDCINVSISKLNNLKVELQAVTAESPRMKGKAVAEQNRIYFTRINEIDLGCNAGKNGNIKPPIQIKNPIPDHKNPVKNRNK